MMRLAMEIVVIVITLAGCSFQSGLNPAAHTAAITRGQAPATLPGVTGSSSPTPESGNPFTPQPTVTSTPTSTNTPLATSTPRPGSPIHALRLDEGYDPASRALIGDLEAKMREANINLVALGAGRPEWTNFKWKDHPERWSSDVQNSGTDFLEEDAARFGKWAHVDAVVDVFAPQYIKKHPETAALSWLNQPSQYLVNTTELVDGAYGQMVLDMIEAIAINYPVDSISITEMMYYTEGYSDVDKAAFAAATGRKDWPRLPNGLVNIDDPAIGEWRSQELARFVAKAKAITAKYGKALDVDVGVSWKAPGNLGQEMGTRYDLMLGAADKIIVWDYSGLNNVPPNFSEGLARTLTPLGGENVILSVGLWGKNNTVISAPYMQQVIQAAQRGGIQNIWITPSQFLTDQHWAALVSCFQP
ncbi:MAG: hypothetical protein PHQ40_01760 [Anaerolineaceae bacterium]|nr:hypothetical protein [Anaerolineaceae bacterium]